MKKPATTRTLRPGMFYLSIQWGRTEGISGPFQTREEAERQSRMIRAGQLGDTSTLTAVKVFLADGGAPCK